MQKTILNVQCISFFLTGMYKGPSPSCYKFISIYLECPQMLLNNGQSVKGSVVIFYLSCEIHHEQNSKIAVVLSICLLLKYLSAI